MLGNGQAVPAGELVLWPHGKEQPVAVLPQSSVPLVRGCGVCSCAAGALGSFDGGGRALGLIGVGPKGP